MDPTIDYAICLAGLLITMLVVAHVFPPLVYLGRRLRFLALERLCYCYVVNRHAILGPWSAASILVHLLYVLVNLVCMFYGPASISEAGTRAGTLSLINMAPVFLSTHLSFLADLFGVSLKTYTRIHRSCGIVAANLLFVHGLLSVIERGSFSLDEWPNRYAIIVS